MRQAGRSGAPWATRVTNTRGQQPHTESTVVSQTDSPGVKPILDLVAFRLLLVRNWPVILGCLLAGIGAGLLLTALSPKSYSASASGVVAVRGSNDIGGVLTRQHREIQGQAVPSSGEIPNCGSPGTQGCGHPGES